MGFSQPAVSFSPSANTVAPKRIVRCLQPAGGFPALPGMSKDRNMLSASSHTRWLWRKHSRLEPCFDSSPDSPRTGKARLGLSSRRTKTADVRAVDVLPARCTDYSKADCMQPRTGTITGRHGSPMRYPSLLRLGN